MAANGDQKDILASLNKAQLRAVTSASDTVAILAGPGCGKTHTLTSRVVWLIQNAGYLPSNVVVATFTVKAAREMKERIGKILGEATQKKIVLGTFHSIARRYLASYGKHIGINKKFGIADDNDSRAMLDRIIKRLQEPRLDARMVKGWISKKKSRGSMEEPDPGTVPSWKEDDNLAMQRCYDEYQEQLAKANLLDYDDLLVRCVELLRKYPICVSNVQVVLVDEYQDTNGIQYDLMKLFAQHRHRISIVGDPDQSIYGWRSAEIRNLHRLLREFPDTDTISLEENYRSSKSILSASLGIIQQDASRYEKALLAVHSTGTKPVLRRLKSAANEGEWIVSEILRTTRMSGGMLKRKDCAILLRSAALSRHVEAALGKKGIAYQMIGGHKFYERKEIKILLDYLRVVHQPHINDAVSRIINVPRRGVGKTTIQALLEESEEGSRPLWTILEQHCDGTDLMPRLTTAMGNKLRGGLIPIITDLKIDADEIVPGDECLVGLVRELISRLDYTEYLKQVYPDDHEQRWASVEEFINLVSDFEKELGAEEEDALPEIYDAEQERDDSVLGRFLANIALSADSQKDKKEADTSAVVTISTIHAAKGLEWPVVFVPCVYEGSIPHSRAEDTNEECRLLYVAMTRAKILLYLSCPSSNAYGNGDTILSSFVSELADTAFAEQGPSFDRHVIEGAAKILGREAPSEDSIFEKLAPLMSTEDDVYPVDPYGSKRSIGGTSSLGGSCSWSGHNSWNGGRSWNGSKDFSKRSRFTGSGTDADPLIEWKAGYSTTMDQSSNFTMVKVPGFTTASARQTTIAAEEAAAQQKQNAMQSGKKTGTKRKRDQPSLLNYVELTAEPSASVARAGHGMKAAVPPAIEPQLSKHKIAQKPVLLQPGSIYRAQQEGGPKKPYACFSSSPVRPASPEEVTTQVTARPSRMPALNRPMKWLGSGTSFESGNVGGGLRRPQGLGPPPSIDKLRQPFKPLTLNRTTMRRG